MIADQNQSHTFQDSPAWRAGSIECIQGIRTVASGIWLVLVGVFESTALRETPFLSSNACLVSIDDVVRAFCVDSRTFGIMR